MRRFVTAVSLPDLVSRVALILMCLRVVDPFALRCVFDAIDLSSSRLTFCRFFFNF